LALFTTQVATGAGALSWVLAEWKIQGKPTTLGAASGAVAGLVGITPGAGFVGPLSAIVIGLVAGALCYFAVLMKARLGYDDALDVVGVHGIGGLWGALATGLFASVAWNPDGADGLFFGNAHQFVVQAIGAGAAIAYSMVLTFLILKAIDAIIGLRAELEDEVQGLDVTDHKEVGYSL
jgi:Amt family ammonium transporter